MKEHIVNVPQPPFKVDRDSQISVNVSRIREDSIFLEVREGNGDAGRYDQSALYLTGEKLTELIKTLKTVRRELRQSRKG